VLHYEALAKRHLADTLSDSDSRLVDEKAATWLRQVMTGAREPMAWLDKASTTVLLDPPSTRQEGGQGGDEELPEVRSRILSTLHYQPYTGNLILSTLHYQPYTINRILSTVYYQPCVSNLTLSTLYWQPYTINLILSTVY
jgi:hypothetical protein